MCLANSQSCLKKVWYRKYYRELTPQYNQPCVLHYLVVVASNKNLKTKFMEQLFINLIF